jgi:hypothetical protein
MEAMSVGIKGLSELSLRRQLNTSIVLYVDPSKVYSHLWQELGLPQLISHRASMRQCLEFHLCQCMHINEEGFERLKVCYCQLLLEQFECLCEVSSRNIKSCNQRMFLESKLKRVSSHRRRDKYVASLIGLALSTCS